jgi:hypothetical protein
MAEGKHDYSVAAVACTTALADTVFCRYFRKNHRQLLGKIVTAATAVVAAGTVVTAWQRY